MTINQVFSQLNIPFAYMRFQKPQKPPYVIYLGSGQDTFGSDNTWYYRNNRYQIEYYFDRKNEATEKTIEDALLTNGYNYQKSEDVYIEDENVFVIYYTV